MVDGVVIGTTIVSMVVNGMCCAYQQHEEEENRVKIRRDLRARVLATEDTGRRNNARDPKEAASEATTT